MYFVSNCSPITVLYSDILSVYVASIHLLTLFSENKAYSQITLGMANQPSTEQHKVLGVTWNFVEDELLFDLTQCPEKAKNRSILQLAIFDP